MTSVSHKDILKYVCRICGEIAHFQALVDNDEEYHKLGWKLKTNEEVSYVLQNVKF